MTPIPEELQVELQIIYNTPRKVTHPTLKNLSKPEPAAPKRESKRSASTSKKRGKGRGHFTMWPY